MTLEEAKEILKDYNLSDGNIVWGGKPTGMNPEYACYWRGGEYITLDGEYTAEQLEAIAIWMRYHD